MGVTTFTGSDGTLLEVDTDDREAQRAYRDAWEHRRDLLRAIAHRLHIILLPVRTDEEIHLTLIRTLEQRARSRVI
jgi:hypothetical protein